MPEQFDDIVANGLVAGVLLFSAATWFYIFSSWRQRPILPFEPRRPVPWGPAAGLLAVLFALKPLVFSSGADAPQNSAPNDPAPDVALFLLDVIVSELFLVGGFVFFVMVLSGAKVRDVGLPTSKYDVARDIFIGLAACAAAIVPVIAIQAILQLVLQNKSSGHELIRMLSENKPTPLALALSAVTVVVVAPVCEELTFRLLLQGWLESWEFKKVCGRVSAGNDESMGESPATEELIASDEIQMTNTENGQIADLPLLEEPPRRGIAGLPFGWFPILVSSLLFALAHFGYGPEPVPLFFLAIVLGFVYQRTHRILPSIVAHALFNSFSLIILWLTHFHVK